MSTRVSGGRSRRRSRSVVALVVSTLVLTACGQADAEAPPAVPGATPTATQRSAVPEASRVGAAGSACELPVTFGLAESWKPEAVNVAPDDPLAELARRGPVTMVCEIDAKPAGNIGFLRVWTGEASPLRSSLTAFIGTEAREPVFTELRIGDRPGLEVVYREKSQLDEGTDRERAFAVEVAQGVVVVSLDSMDSAEHEAMLPAYELAKSSLTVAR